MLDGVATHMADYPDDAAFRSADLEPTDVTEALRASGAEILVCYLPVGSERAVKHYAQACLDAGVAMVNCVPVFLASDPEWAQKFQDARPARSSATTSRARSARPSSIARWRGCSPTGASTSIGPINSILGATPTSSTCWSAGG